MSLPVVDKGQSLMSEKLPTHLISFTSKIKLVYRIYVYREIFETIHYNNNLVLIIFNQTL